MMRNMAADDYESSGASDGIDCADSDDSDVTCFSGSSSRPPAAFGACPEEKQEWPCRDCHSFHPAAYKGCPISFRRRKQAEDKQGAPKPVKGHAGSPTPLTVFSYRTARSQCEMFKPNLQVRARGTGAALCLSDSDSSAENLTHHFQVQQQRWDAFFDFKRLNYEKSGNMECDGLKGSEEKDRRGGETWNAETALPEVHESIDHFVDAMDLCDMYLAFDRLHRRNALHGFAAAFSVRSSL
jgi:hypothetical protein